MALAAEIRVLCCSHSSSSGRVLKLHNGVRPVAAKDYSTCGSTDMSVTPLYNGRLLCSREPAPKDLYQIQTLRCCKKNTRLQVCARHRLLRSFEEIFFSWVTFACSIVWTGH